MRLKRADKEALAKKILSAVLVLLQQHGHNEKDCGGHGMVRRLNMGAIRMLHTNPSSRHLGMPAPNGLDIWFHDKVFSVWWHPFKIVCFKYGEWMNELVSGSFESKTTNSEKTRSRNGAHSQRIIYIGLPPGGLPDGPLKWIEDQKSGRLKLVSVRDGTGLSSVETDG